MRRVLDHPRVYALWQAPFVHQKLAPFVAHNRLAAIRKVLDVGCGPGTNAALFADKEYLGIDLDAGYVERATRRFGPRFRQGDAGAMEVPDFAPVDCLFINSLTHHLDDATMERLLGRGDLVTGNGKLHLIDLYLPPGGIARRLALADRGEHPRPLAELRALIDRHWAIEVEEPFTLRLAGIDLWAMVYFRAAPRS